MRLQFIQSVSLFMGPTYSWLVKPVNNSIMWTLIVNTCERNIETFHYKMQCFRLVFSWNSAYSSNLMHLYIIVIIYRFLQLLPTFRIHMTLQPATF